MEYNTGYGIAELSAVRRRLTPPPQARPSSPSAGPMQDYGFHIPKWAPYVAGAAGLGLILYFAFRRRK